MRNPFRKLSHTQAVIIYRINLLIVNWVRRLGPRPGPVEHPVMDRELDLSCVRPVSRDSKPIYSTLRISFYQCGGWTKFAVRENEYWCA
jgi:hypothetical protein